jgi:hypothetical protein
MASSLLVVAEFPVPFRVAHVVAADYSIGITEGSDALKVCPCKPLPQPKQAGAGG